MGSVVVLSEEETVSYLMSESFRPAEEVVLTDDPPVDLPGGVVVEMSAGWSGAQT